MEFGLIQKQTTSLIMTQELRQAIHLLQLSAVELTNYIYEQALENPLIDVKESPRRDERIDVYVYTPSRNDSDPDEYVSPIDYALVDRVRLSDYLMQQVQEMHLTREERKRLTYFIYSLREDGYLSRPLADLCSDLKMSEREGEEILTLLQQMDPAGIGARNLQECLLLQLERLPRRYPLAEQIVRHYMEPFASRKWKQLAAELAVPLREIQAVYDLLQTLDPRPGIQFSDEPIPFVTPEVKIVVKEGDVSVELIDYLLPTVRLNEDYVELLRVQNREVRDYARQMGQKAQWLIRSIEQRKETILKVAEAIVNHQRDYFLKKDGGLKPLTLKEIADEIGVHESTVSRATMNKYAETPRGMIELKALFTSALATTAGERTSSQTIKDYMKQLIATENKKKPLSDAKIAEWLKAEKKIIVSRRAIAKYREELGIPSSTKRKRFE